MMYAEAVCVVWVSLWWWGKKNKWIKKAQALGVSGLVLWPFVEQWLVSLPVLFWCHCSKCRTLSRSLSHCWNWFENPNQNAMKWPSVHVGCADGFCIHCHERTHWKTQRRLCHATSMKILIVPLTLFATFKSRWMCGALWNVMWSFLKLHPSDERQVTRQMKGRLHLHLCFPQGSGQRWI